MKEEEVITIARSMRAIFLSECTAHLPLSINTTKFARVIAEHLDISIDSRIVPGPEMGDHLRGICLKKENGDALILISSDNNECWQRFVFIKEVCHVFLEDKRCNDPEQLFDAIVCGDLNDEYFESEYNAVVAAIEVMLPESSKDNILHLFNVEKKSKRKIAEMYRVPEKYVDRRLRDWGIV